MAITFTIGGATKALQSGWRITESLNGRNLMDFSVWSSDGTYRPAVNAVVAFADGATTLYAGLVQARRETGVGGYASSAAIDNAIGAVDYNVYPEKRIVEFTIPAGSNLKAGLTILAGILNTSYGTTLSGSQANGPTFSEDVVFPVGTVASHLDKLSVMTGYSWDISYANVLSMSAPGTLPDGSSNPAPFNLAMSGSTCPNVIGDIEVLPSLSEYANYIKVRYSSAAETAYAFFQMTGNPLDTQTVTVGGKTYTYQTTLTDVDGNVQIDSDYHVTLTNLHRAITLQGTPGTDYAASMTLNTQVTAGVQNDTSLRVVALQAGAAGNSIACTETCANSSWRTEGGAATATLLFGADESLSLWVTATNGATPRVDAIFDHAEIKDQATAQLMANGYLVRSLAAPNEIRYRTRTGGLHPGMAQDIVIPSRNLNATCLITEVIITADGPLRSYDITAVEALVIPAGHLEIFKKWNQGGGSGGGASSGQSIVTLTIGQNGLINSGATSWGLGTGFWLDYNAGTPRFRVGDPSGNQINWDGTNLKITSLNLTIDQNGVLIAPDATARSEDNGYRFGAGFGSYGTLITTGPPNYQILDLISDYAGFGHTARVNIRASATTDPSTASLVLQGVQTGASSAVLTADTITLTGTLTIGSATYPGTATPAGAYLRADGTNWITSTLILPNAITANQVVYGSATNTYGASANLTFDGTTLSVIATDGSFTSSGVSHRFDRYSNTAANGSAVNLRRARGTTPGTAAAVDVDDSLGALRFRGHDGTGYIVGASIEALIDEAVATNDLPTRLVFSTTPEGGSSPVEHLRVTSWGAVRASDDGSGDRYTELFGSAMSMVRYGGDPDFSFFQANGSAASPAASIDGDKLGTVVWFGHDGANHKPSAVMEAFVDGTVGTDEVPSNFIFSTTPVGGSSPVEAMRLGPDQVMVLAEPLPGASGGTGYTSVKAAGISTTLSTSYISGTGTTGSDGANAIVKTIVVAANTLTQVGDRLKITVHWRPDTGTAIVGRLAFNGTTVGTGVTVGTATSGTGTAEMVTSVILEYIDSTHANVWAYSGTGAFDAATSAANVAAFAWTASQNISLEQSNIANNHIVVFSLVAEVWPMGVVAA